MMINQVKPITRSCSKKSKSHSLLLSTLLNRLKLCDNKKVSSKSIVYKLVNEHLRDIIMCIKFPNLGKSSLSKLKLVNLKELMAKFTAFIGIIAEQNLLNQVNGRQVDFLIQIKSKNHQIKLSIVIKMSLQSTSILMKTV